VKRSAFKHTTTPLRTLQHSCKGMQVLPETHTITGGVYVCTCIAVLRSSGVCHGTRGQHPVVGSLLKSGMCADQLAL
jgi:hypothetical protein